MFITPIFWPPDTLKGTEHLVFVDFNPFYHVISVVREPLLGQVPSIANYLSVLSLTIAGWALTYLFLRRFRSRIAYWS
jgi:ABC-type polysaccharide/polyol phosphate export permease